MRLPALNLYVKIGFWMLLNLALLAVVGGIFAGYALFAGGYDGVIPASFFSVRSDSVLRVVSYSIVLFLNGRSFWPSMLAVCLLSFIFRPSTRNPSVLPKFLIPWWSGPPDCPGLPTLSVPVQK